MFALYVAVCVVWAGACPFAVDFVDYIEDFYSIACYFAALDYVVMFEGPGQGVALKEFGFSLIYQWAKPAKAVLDYFHLDDVIWL